MRSQLRLSEFAELHTLMTDPPTEREEAEVNKAEGRTASQACPLTKARRGIAVCDRPHVFDYRCLFWAILPPCLPTTAPAAARNGVEDIQQAPS